MFFSWNTFLCKFLIQFLFVWLVSLVVVVFLFSIPFFLHSTCSVCIQFLFYNLHYMLLVLILFFTIQTFGIIDIQKNVNLFSFRLCQNLKKRNTSNKKMLWRKIFGLKCVTNHEDEFLLNQLFFCTAGLDLFYCSHRYLYGFLLFGKLIPFYGFSIHLRLM